PSMARSLAGNEETWYRVLTDGATGAFLPLPAQRYQPTAAMLEHLRLRHSMCAVPGCTRPTSWASECDHIEECLRGTEGEGGLTEIENLHLLCWQHHLDKTNGLLDPTRLPTTPTEPGRTRWSIGTSGDAITVIDDLDTASIQIAEDLAQAWTSYLRGTHAADPATSPITDPASSQSADALPEASTSYVRAPPASDPATSPITGPAPDPVTGSVSSTTQQPEPPGRSTTRRVIPRRPTPPEHHPPAEVRDADPASPHPPHRRPAHETEHPPDPWNDLGPPPF